jgi:hypothetical protein
LAHELEDELEVAVQEPLLKLVREERLSREGVSGMFLYCFAERDRRRQQLMARRARATPEPFGTLGPPGAQPSEDVRKAVILFLSSLDEKRRRLFAELESLRLEHGGDKRTSEWTGLDAHALARGRRGLLSGELGLERTRKEGGRRKSAERKRQRRPRVLLEGETAGDPMTRLKWT